MNFKNSQNLTHDRTVVYNMGYHIVWSVKYRKEVLVGKVETSLKEILSEVAQKKDFIIKEIECDRDHIHVVVSAKPKVPPAYLYKMMKGISARKLFVKYPELKKK